MTIESPDIRVSAGRRRELPVGTRVLIMGLDARQGSPESVGQFAQIAGRDGFNYRLRQCWGGPHINPSYTAACLHDAQGMYDVGDLVEVTGADVNDSVEHVGHSGPVTRINWAGELRVGNLGDYPPESARHANRVDLVGKTSHVDEMFWRGERSLVRS